MHQVLDPWWPVRPTWTICATSTLTSQSLAEVKFTYIQAQVALVTIRQKAITCIRPGFAALLAYARRERADKHGTAGLRIDGVATSCTVSRDRYRTGTPVHTTQKTMGKRKTKTRRLYFPSFHRAS